MKITKWSAPFTTNRVISNPGFSSKKNRELQSPSQGVIGTIATTDSIVLTSMTRKSVWPMYAHEYTVLIESRSMSESGSDHTETTA